MQYYVIQNSTPVGTWYISDKKNYLCSEIFLEACLYTTEKEAISECKKAIRFRKEAHYMLANKQWKVQLVNNDQLNLIRFHLLKLKINDKISEMKNSCNNKN